MKHDKEAARAENPVAETAPKEPRYTKRALMRSPQFRRCRDLLGVLLDDDKVYTPKEAERLMNDYKKAKVK